MAVSWLEWKLFQKPHFAKMLRRKFESWAQKPHQKEKCLEAFNKDPQGDLTFDLTF